jgi:hypothetical protein
MVPWLVIEGNPYPTVPETKGSYPSLTSWRAPYHWDGESVILKSYGYYFCRAWRMLLATSSDACFQPSCL